MSFPKLVRLVLPFSLLAGCAGVLGIEDAQLEKNTASGGSGSGSGGASGTDAGDSASILCTAYCTAVMTNCADPAQKQYVSTDECLAVCKAFPPGKRGDTNGNTVECRLHYALLAGQVGEQDINCPSAGPTGGPSTGALLADAKCGTKCEAFCSIVMNACTGDNAQYATIGDCKSKCVTLPDPTSFNTSVTTGNSIACRTYHVSAATLDPSTHCAHANVDIKSAPCN
jgi:hypothetical protein